MIERKETHLVSTETTDQGHVRVEVRRYWQTEKIEWFADRPEWEGLRSVGVVKARRTVSGKESVEWRYYLSSLENDAEKFARAVRGHWSVENSLPWVLDVVFGEDQSRARTGYAAENLTQTRDWRSTSCGGTKLAHAASKANSCTPPSTPLTSNPSSKTDIGLCTLFP